MNSRRDFERKFYLNSITYNPLIKVAQYIKYCCGLVISSSVFY